MSSNKAQGTWSKYPLKTAGSFDHLPCTLHLRGFTLIEVLIAMTMLSIMMVLLFTSLKICADSWEKGESKITDVNEMAVVYNFFQRDLSVAKPLWNVTSAEEEKTFSFQGSSQSLQFVSAFPASANRSGLQLFSLNLSEDNNEQVIIVTLVPFIRITKDEQLDNEEVTLIRHVSDFTLAYFGSADGISESAWTDEWLNKEALPRLVKINIQLDNGIYWPAMIIDLKVTATTDNTGLDAESTANINLPEAFQ
jgi:general secretion pathway protein J